MRLWLLILSLLIGISGFAQPSNNVIWIDVGNTFFKITARENPELLFDADTAQKMDQDGDVSFSSPNEFVAELKDSVWSNIKLRVFNGFGATQSWTIELLDSNFVVRWTNTFSGAGFAFKGYSTVPGSPDTVSVPIKYVYFLTTNAASDVRQLEVSANKVAYCPTRQSLYAKLPKSPKIDPGIKFQGGSALPGKDTVYMKLSDGKSLYPSFRYAGGNTWQYNRDQTASYFQQPTILNTEGDIYTTGGLQFHKYHGERTHFYINAPSIKADPTGTLTSSTPYTTMANALNFFKDIPKGSDSTDRFNWRNQARLFSAFAAMYGKNALADTTGLWIRDDGVHAASNKTRGRDAIQVLEIGNEQEKTWGGVTAYHSPRVMWAHLRAVYDSIKLRDPQMQVYVGATIKIDTNYWKAIVWLDYMKTGIIGNAPFDGVCFNQYHSTTYEGQPSGDEYSAISPEQFRNAEKMAALGRFRDRWMPNKGIRYTELGYSISGGPFDVVPVAGMPDSVVAAALMMRAYETTALAWGCIDALFNYKQQSDGTVNFAGMYAVRERFQPGVGNYIGSDRLPLWWAMATRINALYDYKAWGRAFQTGDSTGVYVVERDHNTDRRKKAYSVWKGSYNGTSASVTFPVGDAATATLVTYSFGSETGTQTPLTITNKTVTVTANEMPQYIVVDQKPFPWPFRVNLSGYRTQ